MIINNYMGLENCFSKTDDRFDRMVKASKYKSFLESIEEYRESDPNEYEKIVKNFEKKMKKTYFLSPHSRPTSFEK